MQVLRVYLSDEADLFFLHTLEVSEEDFSALKAEQGILVDFGSFPAKLISLLEKCIASRVQDPPRRVRRSQIAFLSVPPCLQQFQNTGNTLSSSCTQFTHSKRC